MATPCGLYREEAKSCINNTGICQALDANGNPCGQRLAVHPREAQASVPSQAQGKSMIFLPCYLYLLHRSSTR